MIRMAWAWGIWLSGFGLALAQGLPENVMKRMQSDPQAHLDLAAEMIHGFGGEAMSVLTFDSNADRWVALAEVKAAMLALGI